MFPVGSAPLVVLVNDFAWCCCFFTLSGLFIAWGNMVAHGMSHKLAPAKLVDFCHSWWVFQEFLCWCLQWFGGMICINIVAKVVANIALLLESKKSLVGGGAPRFLNDSSAMFH